VKKPLAPYKASAAKWVAHLPQLLSFLKFQKMILIIQMRDSNSSLILEIRKMMKLKRLISRVARH